MADRNRLAAEKQKLEERKQRLSVITSRPDEDNVDGSIVNIEKGEPEKSNGQKTFDYLFKIVIIGDATCGKTSLMKRFIDDTFYSDSLSTIGVDFNIKTISIDGTSVKLQIWDTAGQERFAPLGSLYYHGADAVILVYDITDRKTFDNIERWRDKFEDRPDHDDGTVKVLVGCKADLGEDNQREVNEDAGKAAAVKLGSRWIETSAKTGHNVKELFDVVAETVLERRRAHLKQISDMSRSQSNSSEPTVEIIVSQSSHEGKVKMRGGSKRFRALSVKPGDMIRRLSTVGRRKSAPSAPKERIRSAPVMSPEERIGFKQLKEQCSIL